MYCCFSAICKVYLKDECADSCACCHTGIKTDVQTCSLTRSLYIDTAPASPSAASKTPSAWQGSHKSTSFKIACTNRPRKARFDPPVSSLLVKEPALRAAHPGFDSCCAGIFPSRVIPATYKLALLWPPCQAPGVIG